MKWKLLFILCLVYIAYICIGGGVFQALEQENEDEVITSQAVAYEEFLNNKSCVTRTELEAFIKGVIRAYDQGVIQTDANQESNWDFANAVFFSITVVTTIGYGNLSPATFGGKMFFIVYALIGIPIAGILLAGLGEKMCAGMKKLKARTFVSKCPKVEAIFKTVLLFMSCLLVLVFIPSVIFKVVEGWSFGDSVYYCIVTMTTVGFGDFVPASTHIRNRTPYRLFVAVWIMFGLAWLAMIINTIATFYNEEIAKTNNCISIKKKNKNLSSNNSGYTNGSTGSVSKKEDDITNL